MSKESKLKSVSKTLWIVFAVVVGLGIIGSLNKPKDAAPTPPAAQKVEEQPSARLIDKSPAMQKQREDAINEMIKRGAFTKVVRNGTAMPRAWVTLTFTNTDYDTKQKLLGVVYAYYFSGDEKYASIALIDSRTGKEIGRFDRDGLRLD